MLGDVVFKVVSFLSFQYCNGGDLADYLNGE